MYFQLSMYLSNYNYSTCTTLLIPAHRIWCSSSEIQVPPNNILWRGFVLIQNKTATHVKQKKC